jgi:hypothetical protein
LFGKAITHFTRIACVLQGFEDGVVLMRRLSKECRHNLSNNLISELDEVFSLNPNRYTSIITREVLERAKRLTEYFILHRLFMAGYTSGLEIILNNQVVTTDILQRVIEYQSNDVNVNLAKEILMTSGLVITCQEIAKKKTYKAKEILETFINLDEKGVGKYTVVKNSQGPATKQFVKFKTEYLEVSVISTLQFLGINIDKYEKAMEIHENSSKLNDSTKDVSPVSSRDESEDLDAKSNHEKDLNLTSSNNFKHKTHFNKFFISAFSGET